MQGRTRARLVLASYLLFSLSNVYANPTGHEVISGSADFHMPSAEQLHITASDQTIINWQQFSINASELTKFIQPSATSSVLNRVTGSQLSELLGTLEANGKVFLINPQGVLVGSSAVIDTASFTATTFEISSVGEEILFKGDAAGKIINYGLIKASSGDVLLIGRFVENHGTIEAKEGMAVLAAGQEILLKPTDEEKIFIRPSNTSLGTTGLDQKGLITALQVELKADGSAYAMAINHQGSVKALKREELDGKVFLTVYQGGLNVGGEISADHIAVQANGLAIAKNAVLKTEEQGSITLSSAGGILSHEGSLLSPQGTISISNTVENPTNDEKGLSINQGTIDVSGLSGGSISIVTDSYLGAGQLKADGSSGSGGQINIQSTLGFIETSLGSLSAKGAVGGKIFSSVSKGSLFSSAKREATGSIGGEVRLLGQQVTLAAANINASGATGGGTVLIGGDFQGNNPAVMNATTTYVNESTVINVSALLSGNGGKAIVWADDKTEFYGAISAKAGQAFGDGGMIEISGKENLQHGGTVEASSPNGIAGSVLFDPQNIVIDSTTGVLPQFNLIDPSSLGSGFGAPTPLGNGNVVVTKTSDATGGTSAGAVYLYNGFTGALISTILGTTNDLIGASGITTLTNSNYIIRSSAWNGGRGAATWANGTTGIVGTVSAANSLVGSSTTDFVSQNNIITLTSGNYVVNTFEWSNGAIANVGAATWGSGTTGVSGTISIVNSLIGSTANDAVGSDGSGSSIFTLTNGHYVVGSSAWNNPSPALVGVGAATWGNGLTGITGTVSISNSLIGSTANDVIGGGGGSPSIFPLSINGNYVVGSQLWTAGATAGVGAATWGNGSTGITGTVSISNSLIGTRASDNVSSNGVRALTNGNYVVRSGSWDNPSPVIANVGAATWGNGTTGITGTVSISNSLIGSTANDGVAGSGGGSGVVALTNDHYVVVSTQWDNPGTLNVGAVTWSNGTTGITGTVSISNSLIGTTAADQVGNSNVVALTNNNYVVSSRLWNNGPTADVGAVTWGNGTTGITGTVSISNSLIGSSTTDNVGSTTGVTALTNGNYVVPSPLWNDGATADVGAATWGNGSTGITGTVSISNSLIGSTALDNVSTTGITALANNNYVVRSANWDSGVIANVGAVTWGNGATGITGLVSASNSLIGSTATDNVGLTGVTSLASGNYVVLSAAWDNGTIAGAGAATWGNGLTGITGTVSISNSLVGTTAADAVGSNGVTTLSNGNYTVRSTTWDNGAIANGGATTVGFATMTTTGAVSAINSLVGTTAAGMGSTLDDTSANGSFLVRFSTGPSPRAVVGLFDANQLTFSRGQASTMTIQPSLLTTTLNSGTAVTLQASNDITITNPITVNNPSGNGGNLTLAAGRTLAINANITTDNGNLTLTANDLLSAGVVDAYRDTGNATLTLGNNVVLDAGTGNITLNLLNGAGKTNSGAGDLSLGTSSTIETAGSGIINVNALNNVQLAAGTLIQSTAGVLQVIAGESIIAAGATTIQTTTGDLILVVDNDFPTAPTFGTGAVNFPLAVLSTSGGKLVIFTSERSLNTQPGVINGTTYTPGIEFLDTPTEQWGTYYPHFSGIPFTIFYKNTGTPVLPFPPSTQRALARILGVSNLNSLPASTLAALLALSPEQLSVLVQNGDTAKLLYNNAVSEYLQWMSLNDELFLTDPAYFFSINNWNPLSSRIPFMIRDDKPRFFLQKEPFRMHTRGPIDQ